MMENTALRFLFSYDIGGDIAVVTTCPPIGGRKWPNNGHEIALHSTHYNSLACTHH